MANDAVFCIRNVIELKKRIGQKRTLSWWIKWLFATYSMAFAIEILLILFLTPIMGLAASVELLMSNMQISLFIMMIPSGYICYRYLK